MMNLSLDSLEESRVRTDKVFENLNRLGRKLFQYTKSTASNWKLDELSSYLCIYRLD